LLKLDPAIIVGAFDIYRPEGFTAGLAVKNITRKLEERMFLDDLYGLAVLREVDYDPVSAGEMLVEKLLLLL
jgi:hypothetical protein